MISEKKTQEKETRVKKITQEDLIDFLTKAKTIDQTSKKFKVSEERALRAVKKKRKGHRLISQFNVHDEKTFLLLPEDPKKIVIKKRIWTPRLQKEGQPYIIVKFPNRLDWKKIKIVPISDVAFGSRLHNAELFDEYVNWISRNPQVFIFLNGDILSHRKNLETLEDVMHAFKYKISRIAHKILWAQQGDEERKSWKTHGGFDPLKTICDEFDISYFDEPVYADIFWKKHIFSFFCFHGFTGAQTKGGKINAAIRPLDFQEHIMFTVMSHAQDSLAKEKLRVCRDSVNFDLVEKAQEVIICPTFSKYFGSERARKGYTPPSEGTITCNLEPDGKYYISV